MHSGTQINSIAGSASQSKIPSAFSSSSWQGKNGQYFIWRHAPLLREALQV